MISCRIIVVWLILTNFVLSQDDSVALELNGARNCHGDNFANRFTPYEMMYFALEPGLLSEDKGSNAKFQISFAFRVFEISIPENNRDNARNDGLYLSYTQLSFWDISSDSKPFYDSSYKPEFWWRHNLSFGNWCQSSGIEGGYAHESNGRGGVESRSVDRLFVRPVFRAVIDRDIIINARPRIYIYVDKSNNADIDHYRGYADLSFSIGKKNGIQFDIFGRIGRDGHHGCLQTEFSYPLDVMTGGHGAGYIYVQSFIGYSETLLDYSERSDQPRILIGIAFVR